MSYNLPLPALRGIILVCFTHNGPNYVHHYPPHLSERTLSTLSENAGSDSDDEDYEQDSESQRPCESTDLARHTSRTLTKSVSAANKVLGFDQHFLAETLCPPAAMCNTRFELVVDSAVFLGFPVHRYPNGLWKRNDESDNEEGMSMFHLVFVMDPPEIERNYRIDEMFYYVVSKLLLVLRHEQLRHNYVWKQVQLVGKLKEEGASPSEIAKLSIAKLMADCFDAISASKIANLVVNGKQRSLQIPTKLEFHSLPEPTVPYVPGLYLSSTVGLLGGSLVSIGETSRYKANAAIPDEDSEDAADDVMYYALILFDDPEVIIRDVKAGSVLATFIRSIKPTEPLNKIVAGLESEGKELPGPQAKSFALHLIYWRRARIVPPLHTRANYIVSPMAPLTTNLLSDAEKFKLEFSALPPLPSFLAMLSARSKKPRQFATIIPSRDHKEIYLSALAWLIRKGYVTQLHTFIWLKVLRKVKMKVEEEMEHEVGHNQKHSTTAKRAPVSDNKLQTTEEPDPDPYSQSLEDQIDKIQKKLEWSNIAPNIVFEEDSDTILLDPGRASSLERRWINKIVHNECNLSPELTSVFYKLLRYMNGKSSLELLLLKENVSRSDLRKLLVALEEHIISVRHW